MESKRKTAIIGALIAGAVLTVTSVGVAAAQTPSATPSATPPAQGAPATPGQPGDGQHPCPEDGSGHQARHGAMQGQMQGQMQGDMQGETHAAMQAQMAGMHARMGRS